MGLDYLWGYNGAVRVAEINEACFCGWEALMALLHCCMCSLSLVLLTPGYTRLSYTLPGHNSAHREAVRVYVLFDFVSLAQ